MSDVEWQDCPVEIRSVSDEPQRSAVLRVCRYGETSRRLDRPERFCPGAFTKSVTTRGDRIAFTSQHTDGTGVIKPGSNVARPVHWDTTSDPAELQVKLRFFDNPEGWEAFVRARDGELDGASVGFRPVQERTGADGAREVVEAALHHVALLSRAESVPAYDEPGLLEVRKADVPDTATLLADAAALLARKWDPGLAERHMSVTEMHVLIGRASRGGERPAPAGEAAE